MVERVHIALTGAAGGIGSAVAQRLALDGHQLTLLDVRTPQSVPEGATFHQVDSLDRSAVASALQGVDVVCHVGEIPNLIRGFTHDEVFERNTQICRNVLDGAVQNEVRRFIYTSSCQIYGYWGDRFPQDQLPKVWPIDETQPPAPRNKYAESKVANEAQCRSVAHETGMQTMIFRFPWVMGVKEIEKLAALWPRADREVMEGFWSLVDLRDVVEAYALAVRPDRPLTPLESPCEAFHFVAADIMGDRPIQEKLSALLPHFPRLPADWPSRQPPVTCEKAERFLGWRPGRRLRE